LWYSCIAVAKHRFPKQFYELIPGLYPHFADMLNEAELSLQEFACLSTIRHHGKHVWPDTPALPLADLKAMLVRTGGYTPRSANGYLTQRLQHEKQYLECRKITRDQKATFFPSSPGYRDVLILSAKGLERLDTFNGSVERFFDDATRGVPPVLVRGFLAALAPFADSILKRLAAISSQRAAPKQNTTWRP
jgi:hypothetical protein